MTTQATAQPAKVTRCKAWPNGLGFDCTVGRVKFEVLADVALGRLIAFRLDPIEGITHSVRIVDQPGAEWSRDNRKLAELAYGYWRDRRQEWTKHV